MSSKSSKKVAPKSGKRPAPAPKTSTPWLWIGLVVVAVVVVGAVLILSQGSGAATATSALPAEISVADAAAKRAAGAFVLDVREPSEWEEYHVPGATLIPLGELATRLNEVPKDQEIVVMCRSGNRSQAGRDILKDAGYTKVTSMAGGIKEWSAAGLETVTGP